MLSLYMAATVFGLGITIIDMFGVLGHSSDDGHDSSHGDDGTNAEIPHATDHDFSQGELDHASEAFHDHFSRGLLMRLITYLRYSIYFSLGFGPVGWYAIYIGLSAWQSVMWSVPVGLFVLFIVQILRYIQRKDLDSQVKEEDLLMQVGYVLVTIHPGQMGKVKISLNYAEGKSQFYVERFARAQDKKVKLMPGTAIRVVDLDEHQLIVSTLE